jgi:aerobic C4-dicarboxylate transport protein
LFAIVGGVVVGWLWPGFGADRIMDSMRVSGNLLGNCVATLVVARWEGQLDSDRMRKVLRGEEVEPLDDDVADAPKEPAASPL